MYLTDFREESLVHVIESLDTQLFERVTALTLGDFHALSDVGVFNAAHMNEAVWQFRLFERASLHYLSTDPLGTDSSRPVGLWDQAITEAGLDVPVTSLDDALLSELIAEGLLEPGAVLAGAGAPSVAAVVTDDYGLAVAGVRYGSPDDAASAASGGLVDDGWEYWIVPGLGTLAELAGLLGPE
jgi:hypothetical protein